MAEADSLSVGDGGTAPETRAPGRWTGPASMAFGATAWLTVVAVRLASVDERWWITRDDGVITLSHARNLVRFGSIGVSPGGDRVEGFSSPLHFAAAAVVQVVSDAGYRATSLVLLAAAVALIGASVGWLFVGMSPAVGGRPSPMGRAVLAGVASTCTALATAASWTAVGWMGSGMENPLVVAAGVTVVAAAFRLDDRAAPLVLAAASFALFVSRVELAAIAVPVSVATVVAVASRRGVRLGVVVGAVPVALAVGVHIARRWYFGEWLPNTAIVQDRAAGSSQVLLIGLISLALFGLLVRGVAIRCDDVARRTALDAGSTCVVLLCTAAVVWMSASGRTAGRIDQLVLLPALLPLVSLVACLVVVLRALGGRLVPSDHVALAVVMVPVTQYVAAGPARLDQFRVAGIVAPFLVIWAGVLIVRIRSGTDGRLRLSAAGVRRGVAIGLAVAVLVPIAWVASNDQPRRLDYEIGWAEELVDVAVAWRADRLAGGGQVILANPDLGKVSFSKVAVMVDLGLLGDPVMARLHRDHPELVPAYLERIAMPDVVSTHSGWSCEYREWLEADGFVDGYRLAGSDEDWRRTDATCPLDGRRGIWVRVGSDAEYALTRQLLETRDSPSHVRAVGDALAECVADATASPLRCGHVRRAVQRAAAHLRSAGAFDDVVATFDVSPTRGLDVELLERRAGWADRAVAEVIRHLSAV